MISNLSQYSNTPQWQMLFAWKHSKIKEQSIDIKYTHALSCVYFMSSTHAHTIQLHSMNNIQKSYKIYSVPTEAL